MADDQETRQDPSKLDKRAAKYKVQTAEGANDGGGGDQGQTATQEQGGQEQEADDGGGS
jgi:hypothetical protein